MTRKRRSSAECLAEAQRAEADARVVSLKPHKDQLLAIAGEWRKLAAEAEAHEARQQARPAKAYTPTRPGGAG